MVLSAAGRPGILWLLRLRCWSRAAMCPVPGRFHSGVQTKVKQKEADSKAAAGSETVSAGRWQQWGGPSVPPV